MLKLFALALLGIGIYLLVRQFFSDEGEVQAAARLSGDVTSKSLSPIFRISNRFIEKFLLNTVQNLKIENYRKEMRRKIISAGMEEEITPDQLFAFKIFLALLLPLVIFLYCFLSSVGYPYWLFLGVGVGGFLYPDIWLRSRLNVRQKEIRLAIPFVVDLLTLSTEAGLDFVSAMHRVVEKAKKGALVAELEKALNDIQLGATRADALRKMAWRINMPEISSFTAILVTAEQMGSSIGKVLRSQADQIRHDRFIRAEKAGASASQKILVPLVLFILPAVFIMIFGPLIVRFLTEGL
ncbi:MAG: type II secretion system F family protein [Deltaproteobacteria bacterium]|nr:type II secretion system F family protein [Deltaproteobacteria bacterium]